MIEEAGSPAGGGRLRQRVRYRDPILEEGTLVVAVSQSGETADTLAALREASGGAQLTLAICNVAGSIAHARPMAAC
jgi:glucosamine 6-phosphate synthetase-like amidotransferase/phosphosugar isomerase protein